MTGSPQPPSVSPRERVTAIVLAGGRSSRFGGHKLAVELDGVPLLDHALRAAASVADHIVVAGPARPVLVGVTPAASVGFVVDLEPFAGPLAALAGALREASTDFALVVAGDMPRQVSEVLTSMVARLVSDPAIDAVVLAPPDGADPAPAARNARRQVLPLVVKVEPARAAARKALDAGDRSLQGLLKGLVFEAVPAATWLGLDPSAMTLIDVDTRDDLDRLRSSRTGGEVR